MISPKDPRWTGKPLAVDGVPGTTGGDAGTCSQLQASVHVLAYAIPYLSATLMANHIWIAIGPV
jgi:hypothetical protein